MVTANWFWKQAVMSIVQLGLLFAISVPFAVSIWVASRHQPLPAMGLDVTPDDTTALSLSGIGFNAVTMDVEHAVREAATASHAAARAKFVQVELALHADILHSGIKIRVDPNALRVALETAMGVAIRATPGGQILVTAAPLGRQLHIRIVDDGMNADQRSRESLLRDVETLIALQGGSIVVDAMPGRGTSVTLRLPMPGDVSGAGECAEEVSALAQQEA